MFSGIIEQKAKILDIDNWKITVENTFTEPLTIGQSIAHDGACMTIVDFDSQKYSFFCMEESFKKTNFHSKNIWDFFNVERSLEYWWRVDWHFVSGHIDTIWIVDNIDIKDDNSWIITVIFPSVYLNNIIDKWSITINWVSLTVVDRWTLQSKQTSTNKDIVDNSGQAFFTVSLIPLTQEITNIGSFSWWETVNLEFDMMWKYIIQYMKNINS